MQGGAAWVADPDRGRRRTVEEHERGPKEKETNIGRRCARGWSDVIERRICCHSEGPGGPSDHIYLCQLNDAKSKPLDRRTKGFDVLYMPWHGLRSR